jgi:hypothetical protein
MAANKDSSDVLMTFIDSSGQGVPAESNTVWNEKDTTMMADFTQGNVFELDDFAFGVGLGSSEESRGETTHSNTQRGFGTNALHDLHGKGGSASQADSKDPNKKSGANRFAGYIQSGKLNFPIDMQEVSITKQLETASQTFLRNCLKLIPFQKAVLVKRKFTGNQDFHEAFLRLEFEEPLITSIDWDDGEVVKEKIKFVCRGVKAAYKPQSADGTLLGDAISLVDWHAYRKVQGSGSQ